MKIRVLRALGVVLCVRIDSSDALAALDPSRVVGPERCVVCHRPEHHVWTGTTHATMYTILHKKESAGRIAAAMGVRTIKTDSVCMDCHFTPVFMAGKATSTAGVSCESCHGAARDWINVHNDFGIGVTRETESSEHRKTRLAAAAKAGMISPSGGSLFDLIGRCYGCHTVPNEKLVNVGGHSTGSPFDVVERVDSIRHNFLDSRGVNARLSPEEKRRIYLIGAIQHLRMTLLNAAAASEDGRYLKEASKRVKAAIDDVKAVQDALQLPEIQEMLLAAKGLALRPGNRDEVQYAVNKISAAARTVLTKYDDRRLADLQALFAAPQQTEAPQAAAASPPPAAGTENRLVNAIRNLATRPSDTPATSLLPLKRHVRPPSHHRTIGPASCSFSCHNAANTWWEKDKHYGAADRLLNDDAKAVKIARLYGISPKEMKNGQNICMDCHGTVVSGKEAREASDGVGCESCHGAAGDWVKIHNQNNTFNAAAFASGMAQLADLNRRATLCTGCHYIAEQRLISAGHPSHSRFDYGQALARVRHWNDPLPADQAWKSAVTAAIAQRGPIPAVVHLAAPAPGQVAGKLPGAEAVKLAGASSQVPGIAPSKPLRSADLQPLTEEPVVTAAPPAVTIPPLAAIPENASPADLLRAVKERLEILYAHTGTHQ